MNVLWDHRPAHLNITCKQSLKTLNRFKISCNKTCLYRTWYIYWTKLVLAGLLVNNFSWEISGVCAWNKRLHYFHWGMNNCFRVTGRQNKSNATRFSTSLFLCHRCSLVLYITLHSNIALKNVVIISGIYKNAGQTFIWWSWGVYEKHLILSLTSNMTWKLLTDLKSW